VHIIFGTLDESTASDGEVELSQSLQTVFANFAKNPQGASFAPNWPAYEPDGSGYTLVPSLAKIAYHGNVQLDNFVEPVDPSSTVSFGISIRRAVCLSALLLSTGWAVRDMGPISGFSSLKESEFLWTMEVGNIR
jgi:hypothetical protein